MCTVWHILYTGYIVADDYDMYNACTGNLAGYYCDIDDVIGVADRALFIAKRTVYMKNNTILYDESIGMRRDTHNPATRTTVVGKDGHKLTKVTDDSYSLWELRPGLYTPMHDPLLGKQRQSKQVSLFDPSPVSRYTTLSTYTSYIEVNIYYV